MYEQGYNDAIALLGMEKTAGIGNVLKGAGGWLKNKLPTRKGVQEFMVGSPKKFYQEIRSGKAFGPEGMVAESFRAPGAFNKMVFYGLPGFEMARTAFDDQGNKVERLGQQLGGNLLGIAAFRPLGMVGSMGAGMLGSTAGGFVGKGIQRGIDQVTGKTEQEPSGNPNPYVY